MITDWLDQCKVYYELQKQEVLVYCPFCEHHKPKMSINIFTESWKCWICNASGNQIDYLKKHLANDEVTDMTDYLKSRGLSEFSNDMDVVQFYGKDVIFHQYHPVTKSFAGKQIKDSVNKKYRTEGAEPGFFSPIPTQWENEAVNKVVLVEGAEDSIATCVSLQDTPDCNSYLVIATTGITKYGVVGMLPDRVKEVYIAFDNETKDTLREQVKQAQKAVIQRLRERFASIKIFIINWEKKDANDTLLSSGKDKVRENILQAVEYIEDQIAIPHTSFSLGVKEFLRNPDKSMGLPCLIDGIDKGLGGGERLGEIDALVAQAKQGKTSLFSQLIWLRLRAGMSVGYMSREVHPDSDVIPNLLSIEMKANMFKKPSSEQIDEALRRSGDWKLTFAKGVGRMSIEDIQEFIQQSKRLYGTRYFFLDHFHRLLKESENKEEIAKYITDLAVLVKKEMVHLWIIIQPTKLGPDNIINMNSMRGSVALQQEVDSIWILGKDAETGVSSLWLNAARHKLAKVGTKLLLQYNPLTTEVSEVLKENPKAKAEGIKPPIDDV